MEMQEIREISSFTVQAANHNVNSIRTIELTPWDLQLLRIGTIRKGLLFHKPTPQQEKELVGNNLIDHLRTSLSRTLDFFPPLAGRLGATKQDDNTESFFIDCNNAGAQFTHATADAITVADILEPIYVPPIVQSLFQLNGVPNYEGISKPLLAVQVTELVDGIFIGCAINHSIVDGYSFWNFFNCWSEVARGMDSLSNPPFLERWFPDDFSRPICMPVIDAQLFNNNKFKPAPYEVRYFHFRRETIGKIKAKANSETGSDRISSLQALLAHFWLSVTRCRGIDTKQQIYFNLVIGVRPKLEPPLPKGYFGNAVHSGTIITTAGELLEHGLGWAAFEMNKMVASQSSDEITKAYKNSVKGTKLISMGMFGNNSLTISSSPRFDVYGNDFGWGKPVAVRCPIGNKFSGLITVFPGAGEGSIDIEACLSPETMQAMGEDVEFMESVAVKKP